MLVVGVAGGGRETASALQEPSLALPEENQCEVSSEEYYAVVDLDRFPNPSESRFGKSCLLL